MFYYYFNILIIFYFNRIFRILVRLTLIPTNQFSTGNESRIKTSDKMRKAACWLLCAFVRVVPHFIADILQLFINEDPTDNASVPGARSLWPLSYVCQSSAAIKHLQTNGILKFWATNAANYCQSSFVFEFNIENSSF